jgi:hypothetical protein
MFLDCLNGFIGLDSRIGSAASGLYLDALPDLNLNNTEKIADSSQESYEKVFEDVQKRTILKFRTFFISEFVKCHRTFKREIIDCLICENRELLAEALWYLMGAEMLQERINSNRINRFTTVDKGRSQELQQDFMVEFERNLGFAVAGIDLTESSCFENSEKPECVETSVTFNEFTP